MCGYVELHCHSNFSFLDGASHIEDLVTQAKELGYQALALTDHNGLYGAMEFAQAMRAAELRPITGAELTLEGGYHLTLLAETAQGYANLCRLITHSHLRGERLAPHLDVEMLARHARGLIALSGCRRGELPALLTERRYAEARDAAGRYLEIFGSGNFFIELQDNLAQGDTERNRELVKLAESLGLPLVATNNVHYHRRERHRLQDVLVAIKQHATLETSHALRRPNSEFYLKTPEEMARLFRHRPEAIANTLHIAERCRFDLTRDLNYTFPAYPCPPGQTPDDLLRDVCSQALRVRYSVENRRAAEERLTEELRLIAMHKLAGFFLLYRDILELAKEVAREVYGPQRDRAPGRGRGSSVGSIVCYLIGLSTIDPVANNLFLGRFLNEELSSVPDIDLDFSREVREKLILRAYEYFGPERIALVCSFPTYRTRSAVREVGGALGLPEAELDRLARLAGSHSDLDGLADEMARYPEFQDKLDRPLWRELVALAPRIKGFPRHISQHVGGMIISSTSLIEIVPVERAAMEERQICQWDKDSCDDAKMVKVDFLGLGMLSLVDYCLDEIVAMGKEPVDLSQIDYADTAVYDGICVGDTVGVFQIESRAQMQTLPRTQPRTLEDLIVEVAIIRPGPIIGGAVNPYIARRQGREPVSYYHEDLQDALKETLGVVLYQEQVIEVVMIAGNYTVGQADQIRRTLARKKSVESIEKIRDDFHKRALKRGIEEHAARAIFGTLIGFAEFGFPKSHSAAFALLAYQSAWLKHYYPAEFTCALLNAQPMGFYSPEVVIQDAQRHGVRVLLPDANESNWRCTVEDADRAAGIVRTGFRYVLGLGAAAGAAIEKARASGGPFRSLRDFCWRTGLGREAIQNLIRGGAFDSFGLNRRELLWQLGLVWRPPSKQLPLPLPTVQDEVKLADYDRWERITAEFEVLGFAPHDHPLAALRPTLERTLATSADLQLRPHGRPVRVAGMVVCRQRPGTAKNFTFLTLEDEFGHINLVVRPQVYEVYRALVRAQPFLLVDGELQLRDGTTNILATALQPLNLPRQMAAPAVHHFR